MSIAPWEFVNNVLTGSDSTEGYNTFLTNRTLSSNLRFFSTRVFYDINSHEWSSVPENIRALITAGLIRKNPRFNYKYVKIAKISKAWQDEDIQMVMLRLNCNEDEAKSYIEEEFVSKDTLEQWKSEGFFK